MSVSDPNCLFCKIVAGQIPSKKVHEDEHVYAFHDINPWADARLTEAERNEILSLIEQRITTRKPAAYLLRRTYMQGIPFYVDERVIVPRSYIGEMMAKGLLADLDVDFAGAQKVLDLCTGSGCLAILAAGQFPHAEIHASDLSSDALDVARINLREHGPAPPAIHSRAPRAPSPCAPTPLR